MAKIYDPEVTVIAQGLKLDSDLVQACFEDSLLPTRFTNDQFAEVQKDINTYILVIRKLTEAINAFDRLSDVEKAIPSLIGDPINENFTEAHHYLTDTLSVREATVDRHSRKRGANPTAYLVADLIALVCTRSGIPLTIGEQPITNEPSTKYCRMVKQAFEILEVEGRSNKNGSDTKSPKKVAHWRRPAEAAKAKVLSTTETQ